MSTVSPTAPASWRTFSAFLCGFFYVPAAVYLIWDGAHRLVDAPEVGYALAQIPMVIALSRMVVLYLVVRRMVRRSPNPSPLMRSYLLDYRVGLYSDAGILISFTIGGMLAWLGLSAIGNRVDPMVALAISGYMIWAGVSLVRHNLRSLMDLPLPEMEQLTITRVLARHYADYDAVGSLYTRSSGNRRFVEIELGFDDGQTVGHVQGLSRRMEAALAAELPGLDFRIVPVADVAGQDALSATAGGAAEGDSAPVVPSFLAP